MRFAADASPRPAREHDAKSPSEGACDAREAHRRAVPTPLGRRQSESGNGARDTE